MQAGWRNGLAQSPLSGGPGPVTKGQEQEQTLWRRSGHCTGEEGLGFLGSRGKGLASWGAEARGVQIGAHSMSCNATMQGSPRKKGTPLIKPGSHSASPIGVRVPLDHVWNSCKDASFQHPPKWQAFHSSLATPTTGKSSSFQNHQNACERASSTPRNS